MRRKGRDQIIDGSAFTTGVGKQGVKGRNLAILRQCVNIDSFITESNPCQVRQVNVGNVI